MCLMLKSKIKGALVRYGNWIPDYYFLKVYSYLRTGKSINFKNPKTFNEKINWIKLYDRRPIMTKLADKYAVREYVKEKLGEKYLIPLLWSGKNPEDIPFDELPNSFVIKTNHASGTNIIVKNKSELNREEAIKQLKSWLSKNYYYPKREWAYKEIDRKVVVEEFIGPKNKVPEDYKLFVINEKVVLIQVDHDRDVKHTRSLYDPKWNKLNYTLEFEKSEIVLDKPNKLDELIYCAEILGEGFSQVRIDFYIVDDQLYFGEITFYHGAGFERFIPNDYELNNYYGKLIDLKNLNNR